MCEKLHQDIRFLFFKKTTKVCEILVKLRKTANDWGKLKDGELNPLGSFNSNMSFKHDPNLIVLIIFLIFEFSNNRRMTGFMIL